jgi:hypothetical protein
MDNGDDLLSSTFYIKSTIIQILIKINQYLFQTSNISEKKTQFAKKRTHLPIRSEFLEFDKDHRSVEHNTLSFKPL